MDSKTLDNNFKHHPPSSILIANAHGAVRKELRSMATELTDLCPESPELNMALTKLEEAMFWANAAIARYQ